METLPREIQTIIYQHYWLDYYNKLVINELNSITFQFSNMNLFLKKHFIFNTNDNYDKQISYYLRKYNTLLTQLLTILNFIEYLGKILALKKCKL